MSRATSDAILARVGELPHLPATLLRLVGVVGDPTSTLAQVVDTVRYDQVLTAEVLRACNAACFGLVRRVESLDDAVRLLGTARILQLVLAVHSRALLSRPQAGYGLPAGALWRHSIAVALGAQLLGRRLGLPRAGVLFTAGLLHDVGKVVLNEFVAREYAEIVQRVSAEGCTFCEAEQAVLGCTHPEVGARLAESWALPEAIVRCIRHHHEPGTCAPGDPQVDAVHLADVLGLLTGLGGGDDGLAYRACAAVLDRHRLTHADLDTLGADLITELRSVQALFDTR